MDMREATRYVIPAIFRLWTLIITLSVKVDEMIATLSQQNVEYTNTMSLQHIIKVSSINSFLFSDDYPVTLLFVQLMRANTRIS